ncbi:MAG: chemotaxis protein [Lachnospiraceae bacterium]|nr:chemotaxis protein [Lachnospiraceae bacterium]
MTKEQYRTANAKIFPVVMIILGYFLITFILAVLSGGGNLRIWVQIGFTIVAILLSIFALIKGRETKSGAVTMMTSCAVAYVTIVLLNSNSGVFTYVFALIITSMAFMNMRLVVLANVVAIIANLLRIVIYRSSDGSYMNQSIIEVFSLLLVAIASITVTQLRLRFNEENQASIMAAAKAQEEMNQTMAQVADDIAKNFEEAMRMVEELKQNVDTCNFAMGNIADSTESTAESIQAQASMCVEIRGASDTAESEIRSMLDSSDRTMQTITEGSAEIQKLKEQAENVSSASDATVQVISQLTSQVNNVQEFIGTILNIAGQTNLLALNASIEAARAGEAGKGFAVVADEIRELSEQTKNASNNITAIINDLNAGAQSANDSIEKSAASVRTQNEMIENMRGRFDNIYQEMSELSSNVKKTEESVNAILTSTETISENITQLSATSEEVAASSTEGLRTSETSVENMNSCKEILGEIASLALRLKAN